jgi:iron complex outermembrane receptor protein
MFTGNLRTHRRGRFLAASALSTVLLTGFDFTPASAQQTRPDGSSLPPVTVQRDQDARRTGAVDEKKRGANRRVTRRVSNPRATPAAAPVAPAPNFYGGMTAGGSVDGYVARSTGVGTKMDTPVLALPRTVSTVTAQEITDRDAQSVRDALQYSAGVNTYFREGQFTRDYALIRGFQGLQYIDGLRLNVNNYGLEPYGFERIDVLKGPASTLYGQGSPGGLWDITSKRPTDKPFAEFMIRGGSYGALQGAFDVSGPANADHSLLYRFVGVGKMGDGQIDFTKNERVYLAPSFTWRPDEDTSFTVLASYQKDPNLTALQPLPYQGSVIAGPNGQFISRKLFVGEPSFNDFYIEQSRVGYQFDHRFSDSVSFQQNFVYQHINIKLNEVQGNLLAVSGTPTLTLARGVANQYFNIDMFQMDNKVKAEFDTGYFRHHIMVGVDYSAVPNLQGTGTASTNSLSFYNPVYGQAAYPSPTVTSLRYQDQRQAGTYVQDRIELGKLSFLAGARADDLIQGQKTRAYNPATGVFTNPAWSIQEDLATTTNAGAIYNFNNGIAPYIGYSQTFTPTIGTDFFGKQFVPVTGDQKEIGIKYVPPGYNLSMQIAAFDITQYNVLTPDPLHARNQVQTSSVESRGADFELKTTNLRGLNIAASYTYLDTKVIATNTASQLGKHPVATPMNQAALWTTYRFAGGWLDGFTFGGGVRYVGDQAVDAANTLPLPSFTLFDLTARYELGAVSKAMEKWDIALNVKNVADKRYVGSCDDATDCYYGPGRMISGTLRARFY